jgi:hypothetical protein
LVDGDGSTVWLCEDVRADFDLATETIRSVLLGHRVPPADLALLHDDLLPGWGDEWLLPLRFLHRQLRLLALERAGGDATVTAISPVC